MNYFVFSLNMNSKRKHSHRIVDGILQLDNKKGADCLNMEDHGIYRKSTCCTHSFMVKAALKTKEEEFQKKILKEKKKGWGGWN